MFAGLINEIMLQNSARWGEGGNADESRLAMSMR